MSKIWKVPTVIAGLALTGTAVWLNAEHVAAVEGWHSPLVAAGVIVTACAASAVPLAERVTRGKAAVLLIFFALAVAFSLSASISRSSGYVAGKASAAQAVNQAAQLAQEAYEAAKKSQEAECAKRGPRCRAMELKADSARAALAAAQPAQAVDAGADRLAAVLGINADTVALYVPLFLPLGLELGGFIFLAIGLAPVKLTHRQAAVASADAAVTACEAVAKPCEAVAKPIAKTAKAGSKDYYLQRLQCEHPTIAGRVARGEISVYAATIAAGMRKKPAKAKRSHLKVVA